MPRSKSYMNWKTVSVSHGPGPTTITLTEITGVQIQRGEQWVPLRVDGFVFPTRMARVGAQRGMRITGADVGKLATIPLNTVCTVTCQLFDSVNQTTNGSGTLTFTLSNAVFMGNSPGGNQNEYIMDSVEFSAYSADGTTDPLTINEAA